MLIRLCETARSARGLGSTKSEVIQAKMKDVQSYNGQFGLSSHHKERNEQMFDINPTNCGVNQILSVLNYDGEYMGDWPMDLLDVASELVASRRSAGRSLGLTFESELFNPNLTMYHLRQDEKAAQLIENYTAKLANKFSPNRSRIY
uniref:Uncharacterized protein n=2 Tax=Tetranychus urticae TaxID=32264 RepID=T1KZP3_TETUR